MKDNIAKQGNSSAWKCAGRTLDASGVARPSRIARASAHFMKKNQTAYQELSNK